MAVIHHGSDLKGAAFALTLLELNPAARLGAQAALDHDWFKSEPIIHETEAASPRSVVQPRPWIFSMKQIEESNPSVARGVESWVEKRQHAEVSP